MIEKVNEETQTLIEFPIETQRRLKQEALKLKFVKKWLNSKFTEATLGKKKKVIALHQWRINVCYDE